MHARRLAAVASSLAIVGSLAACGVRRGTAFTPPRATASISAGPSTAPFDPRPYERPQRMVDVGGRRSNVICEGTGSPTVVLEAGLGSDASVWRYVVPAVARTTRVCAYDRAGMGFSGPAPPPRDAAAVAADLDRLLRAAMITPPYVLVGHSLGGLDVRVFLARRATSVVGMVLVDPSTEDQTARLDAIDPARADDERRTLAGIALCLRAARAGAIRAGTHAGLCAGEPDPSLPPAMQRLDAAFRSRPPFWLDVGAEERAIPRSEAEVRALPPPPRDLPLEVLTAGRIFAGSVHATALHATWSAMHAEIARRSARGIATTVPDSGHLIQLDRPDAVVRAIDAVVSAARRPGDGTFSHGPTPRST